MKTRYGWQECDECKGKRFKGNRLCLNCGGDGSVLKLVEVEPTERGLNRLIADIVFNPN